MNLSTLWKFAQEHMNEFTDFWRLKCLGAVVIGVFANMHVQLLLCFALLVVIDLATKVIAISKQYLMERWTKNPSLWECIKGVKKARRAGRIKSSVMKHRFLGKIAVYFIITFAGGAMDFMMRALGKPEWALCLLVGYLAATEVLSIIENLKDAQVSVAEDLHEIVKKKMEGMKK